MEGSPGAIGWLLTVWTSDFEKGFSSLGLRLGSLQDRPCPRHKLSRLDMIKSELRMGFFRNLAFHSSKPAGESIGHSCGNRRTPSSLHPEKIPCQASRNTSGCRQALVRRGSGLLTMAFMIAAS